MNAFQQVEGPLPDGGHWATMTEADEARCWNINLGDGSPIIENAMILDITTLPDGMMAVRFATRAVPSELITLRFVPR